jgi:hypothetical protein
MYYQCATERGKVFRGDADFGASGGRHDVPRWGGIGCLEASAV